jgi:hypothetical protein
MLAIFEKSLGHEYWYQLESIHEESRDQKTKRCYAFKGILSRDFLACLIHDTLWQAEVLPGVCGARGWRGNHLAVLSSLRTHSGQGHGGTAMSWLGQVGQAPSVKRKN